MVMDLPKEFYVYDYQTADPLRINYDDDFYIEIRRVDDKLARLQVFDKAGLVRPADLRRPFDLHIQNRSKGERVDFDDATMSYVLYHWHKYELLGAFYQSVPFRYFRYLEMLPANAQSDPRYSVCVKFP